MVVICRTQGSPPWQTFASLTALAQPHLRCAINESRVLYERLFLGFSSAVAACLRAGELVQHRDALMAGPSFRHDAKHNASVPFRGTERNGSIVVDEQDRVIEQNISAHQT